jgi:hypothetical protein
MPEQGKCHLAHLWLRHRLSKVNIASDAMVLLEQATTSLIFLHKPFQYRKTE